MNPVAVITGNQGGVGLALVDEFSRAGYEVVGIDKPGEAAVTHTQITFDLSRLVDENAVTELSTEFQRLLDSRPVAALINNAAVQHTGALIDLGAEAFLEAYNVNVMAALLLSRLLFPRLQALHGTVVNVTSIHASQTKPGFSPYGISKAALTGLTRAMAVEWGRSVRVLGVSPAAIATPMLEAGFRDSPAARQKLDDYHPTGSIGSPEELARTIVQLVEIDAPFLNGALINMDGGISHLLHDPA